MKDYTIAIICDRKPVENYYCLDAFIKSLGGEDVLAFGYGNGEFKNLSDRPRILHRALKNKIISTPYLIYCDCWDLFFVDDPEVIVEKFLATKADLIVSAEKNCFPNDHKDEFDALNPPTSYKYLNCGFFVGKTKSMLELLDSMDAENKPHDYWDEERQGMWHYNEQGWFMEEFFKKPVDIRLDYYQEYCQCLQDVLYTDLDFNGDKIKNIETETYPSIMHFNGTSKTDGLREPILKYYGYQ